MLRFNNLGMRWEFAPGVALDLDRLLLGPSDPIKLTPGKSVHRVRLHENEFYLKRSFHGTGWRGLIYRLGLRPPRNRIDWRLAQELPRLGVPLVPFLGYGERWGWSGLQETALITQAPPDFKPLHLAPDLGAASVQFALGRFLRGLHDSGVAMRDLHAKNFLYSPDRPRFCLMDLDTVTVSAQVGLGIRLDHLARLHSRIPLGAAFYEGYGPEYSEYEPQILKRAPLLRRKRCLRPNNDFQLYSIQRRQWRVRTEFISPILKRILADPDCFLAAGSRLLKQSSTSTVGCEAGFVVKRYDARRNLGSLKDWFRPSRARRAFLQAYHLELAGIRTARPIAFASAPVRLFSRSYFVMEEIPDPATLRQWTNPGARIKTIRQIAELLGALHEAGFSHRDLKDTNIVLDPCGLPYLIDLDGVRFTGDISDARAAANLARLARAISRLGRYSLADHIRFVIFYCRRRKRRDWRRFWNQLAAVLAADPRFAMPLPPQKRAPKSGAYSNPPATTAREGCHHPS